MELLMSHPKGRINFWFAAEYNKLENVFMQCFFGLLPNKSKEASQSLTSKVSLPQYITIDFELANINVILLSNFKLTF